MLKSLTQEQARPVYQSSILNSNETSNRSARRQAILREKKQEMKEQKKYHKHIDNSGRFNPKKSRKVAPLNPSPPLRNTGATEKKTSKLVHQLTATNIELESEEIETDQEVVFSQQQQQQQQQHEEDFLENKDEDLSMEKEHQEKAPSVKDQEPVVKNIEEKVTTEDILDSVVQEKVHILPAIEGNSTNADTNGKSEQDSNTARKDDETNVIRNNSTGTIEEIKHAPNQYRSTKPVKETNASEPFMTSNAFDKDNISSYTSNRNIKKKPNLITRLFKSSNTSKTVKKFK